MSELSRTVTIQCGYCPWQRREQAINDRAVGYVTRKLRAQLVEHCEKTHETELAAPVPDGAPQPPTTQPDLAEQLAVCQDALRRIGTQHTLTAAKQIAADALQGVAPRQAWNRSTP